MSVTPQGHVKVTAYPRLHLGLLDCSNFTPRRYGGVGITLDRPAVVVRAERSTTGCVVDGLESDDRLVSLISTALIRMSDAAHSVRLHYEGVPPRHVGLGSGTVVVLAGLAAAAAALGQAPTRRDLQLLSGRGGTSGIGINSFFEGGVIFDGGHANPSLATPHLPSSGTTPLSIPPVLIRTIVPPDWRVGLLLPNERGLSAEREAAFFLETLPLPDAEAGTAVALAYHGLAPALAEGDLPAFRSALHRFQDHGLKAKEIKAQTAHTQDCLMTLRETDGVAAGLSSVGPLLFAICHATDSAATAAVDGVGRALGSATVWTLGRNTGFMLEGSGQ